MPTMSRRIALRRWRDRLATAGLGIAMFGASGVFGLLGCIAPPPAQAPTPRKAPADEGSKPGRVLWPGRPVGRLYTTGEVRAFDLFQDGQRVARSWGRYVGRSGERHVFETRIELEVPGRTAVRSVGRLVLDDEGHLVEGFERSDAAELRFARKGSVLSITDGVRTDEITYAPEREPVAVMAHTNILHEELMLGLRTLNEGRVGWRLISLSGGAPVEWAAEVREGDEGLTLETSLGERIEFRDGRIVSIEAESSRLRIEPTAEAWPSWTVEEPRRLTYAIPADARFEIRTVELPGRAGEPKLHGEVLIPRGSEARRPGVVWVSGSGQQDRYGFAGPPPVDLGGHEITDALANAGYVVVRFDERGRGHSEAGPLSFDGQVEDVRRALRTLLVQDEVDPDRIVMVGHGEGGLRVLAAAVGHPEVVGIALLGVPGRPYREAYLRQAEVALADMPPALRKDARAQQLKMLDAIAAGERVPPELEPQAQWIREIMKFDAKQAIAKTPAQLWIAVGSKDFEIDPKTDTAALVEAAKRGRKRPVVATYRGLDHLFKAEPAESRPERYLEARAVDAGFLNDLVAWMKSVAAVP